MGADRVGVRQRRVRDEHDRHGQVPRRPPDDRLTALPWRDGSRRLWPAEVGGPLRIELRADVRRRPLQAEDVVGRLPGRAHRHPLQRLLDRVAADDLLPGLRRAHVDLHRTRRASAISGDDLRPVRRHDQGHLRTHFDAPHLHADGQALPHSGRRAIPTMS